MKRKPILIAVIITFVLTNILTASFCSYINSNHSGFNRLRKVENIIKDAYIGEYDSQKAEDAAIRGMLSSTDDKYAAYYDEEASKELLQSVDGYYYGIGVEVYANTDNNCIEIISAYKGSPADKAGLRNGDLIVSIDSVEYDATKLADASAYLRCDEEEIKTKPDVTISIKRNNEIKNIKVKRDKIDYYRVSTLLKDKILYISYTGFSKSSYQSFENLIKKADKADISGVIIDLRNNPGGDFDSSIQMCDLFLDDGLIMYTLDKKGEKKEFYADKYSFKAPMVIIVNKSTASAAEIFAGSMQARKRSVVIGEKTFGKGTSQRIVQIDPFDESGGAIKITSEKNYTPDDRWLNESVIPDVLIEEELNSDNIEKDAAYLAAMKILKQ